MLLHALQDADDSNCTLTFEKTNGWLRATWRGFVNPAEAMREAEHYLADMVTLRCPYLLNDNTNLRGAWFDTVEWLERVWLPSAQRLGLRCVAHVVQADTRSDILTLRFPKALVGALDLQIFQHVADAEAWLRDCQREAASGAETAAN